MPMSSRCAREKGSDLCIYNVYTWVSGLYAWGQGESTVSASHKVEQLNIRATAAQKTKLAEAARLQNMNVSQFILSKSLDAAEEVIADQRLIRVSKAEADWLLAKLEEPPRDLPRIEKLLAEPSVFER